MTMYFVAIVLPPHLDEKVLHWKQVMQHRYDCRVGLKSPAHITLVPPFWMDEAKEESLLQAVITISQDLSSYTLRTNNFSAFKPRTIFIDLERSIELEEMKKVVDNFFQRQETFPVKIDIRPFHPHITIATRDLFKKSFYEAWPLFEKEEFMETWNVEGISVLLHNKKNWDVIHTSQFQNI